jgi:hypothetical protein
LLTKGALFGRGLSGPYLYFMTFKQLANELMDQGWRCYHIDVAKLTLGSNLQALAIRSLIEVRVYEGKSLVFVKDILPAKEPKEKQTNGSITD